MGTLLSGITGQTVLLTSFFDRLTEDPLTLSLSLGIVFAILILIIQLIYMINKGSGQKRKESGSQKQNSGYVDNVITQIEQREEEELMDQYELVAVITAAIYASMGSEVPADGLVVRSIRRISSGRR